ncbi:stress response protein NST1 [Anarrhichthys ocellatus]|uniref:stress response protein NST1 n=1 Tax=Anarrhichthys ocellatus TaxID=433405 RepID=UPI0012EEA559|nr:stress response protein NST1-like [Anarrhichthys ocellatus]
METIIIMETIVMETIIMEIITMETIAAHITNTKSIITVQLFINTMATIIDLLFPITMETTKASSGHRHHSNQPNIEGPTTPRHHGDHHSPDHKHHHGNHHSQDHKHHHGGHHSPDHKHHHGDHHSPDHKHHHGDHHSPDHKHHHGDHHSPDHKHNHGDHHSPDHKHHHGGHHSQDHKHHHGDKHSEAHLHHHGDHHSKSHHQGHEPESRLNQPHSKNDLDLDLDLGPPLKLDSLSRKKESPSNTSSPSGHDEEHTSFTGSSLHKEKAHELGRIMNLQGQNEGLHQSLLKTAVKMECLGEEFMSSQKLLEAELQRTRIELSNLTERFRRLHDNCSATQQTNSLLEQKLHSVAQSLEGERGRLNQRISALTEQLADAKFANSVETSSVTSVTHNTDLHFQSDDAINQMVPHIAPPPAQFMDGHNNYETAIAGGQEQSLGPVPEEEESDWSEKGDETPQFILTGSNRGPVWRHREADVDKDSESGGEEIVGRHAPCPQQIPHLQFTIHNKNLSDGMTGEGTYRITTSQNLGSAILIRSASLEEIPLARHHMQKELRGTEAMMDLHHQGHEGMEDLDNEIIHHWRSSNDRPIESRTSEADSSLAGLESAERMLSQFTCGSQASEGQRHGRAEVHSRTGGIPDEVLKGERTKL